MRQITADGIQRRLACHGNHAASHTPVNAAAGFDPAHGLGLRLSRRLFVYHRACCESWVYPPRWHAVLRDEHHIGAWLLRIFRPCLTLSFIMGIKDIKFPFSKGRAQPAPAAAAPPVAESRHNSLAIGSFRPPSLPSTIPSAYRTPRKARHTFTSYRLKGEYVFALSARREVHSDPRTDIVNHGLMTNESRGQSTATGLFGYLFF